MIEFIVLLIVVVFIAYLLLTLGSFTVQFLINLVVIVFTILRAKNDIIKKDMYSYYLFSTVIVAFLFLIFDFLVEPIVNIFEKVLIIKFTSALLFIILIAYTLQFIHKKYLESKGRKK